MEAIFDNLQNIDFSLIPIGKIVTIVVILVLTQLLKRFIAGVIIKTCKHFALKTPTTLDDELLDVIEPSLSWIVQLGGFWLVAQILAANLGSQVSGAINQSLNIIIAFILAYVIYRCSSILGEALANVLLRTDTELDQLLKPLMPKLFQAAAIIVLAIKVSEIFLGQSAGALVGLLGGAGITLGLLFKDIIYDWFCTLIIYTDNLYKEGDWVGIEGVNGFVQILDIGFRTTTLHLTKWGSLVKMPNSKMISGIVENWSQNPGKELKWGINLTLKIDGISAQKTARICRGIEEFIPSIPGLSASFAVRFSGIEENARIIEVMAFVNDPDLYFDVEKNLNLGFLTLLEKEGVDTLYVQLECSPGEYKESQQALSNQNSLGKK